MLQFIHVPIVKDERQSDSKRGKLEKFRCNLTFYKLNTYLILTNAFIWLRLVVTTLYNNRIKFFKGYSCYSDI